MEYIVPRLQVFEIDDQSWFPAVLRSRVQTVLASFWNTPLWPLQRVSPAVLIAETMQREFGSARLRSLTVVDFCSGAGGPTPAIERAINQALEIEAKNDNDGNGVSTSRDTKGDIGRSHDSGQQQRHQRGVDFVLTDIAPHPEAWQVAAARSPGRRLHYVPTPVNAAAAPDSQNLLAQAGLLHHGPGGVLRTFHLSFHHFDDASAQAILQDTFRTADAIAVVELVERSFSSLALDLLLLPMATIVPPVTMLAAQILRGSHQQLAKPSFDPVLLFFSWVLPVVPLVVMWDGLMSSLRIRNRAEMMALIERSQVHNELTAWEWRTGREWHTWPLGVMTYVIGWKKDI